MTPHSADRPSRAAVLLPGSGAGDWRPAELIGSRGDGLIRTPGIAVEQGLHHAATGGLQEMGSDALGRPGEITATTSHDHQLAATRKTS